MKIIYTTFLVKLLMTFKKQNSWKYLSVGLLGIIAIGLLTPVDAKPPSGQQDVNQFEVIFDLIADLQMQIDNVDVDDADSDPTNELQTISDNGGVTLSDGGGTVTCADITGDASLCDGDDAVVDNDNDSSNELQGLSGSGEVVLSNGGGTVSCTSITGSADLCDGVDDIGDAGIGLLGFYVVAGDLDGIQNTATINCDDGDIATGGGGTSSNPMISSEPIFDLSGWRTAVPGSTNAGEAIVVCADFAPVHENAD